MRFLLFASIFVIAVSCKVKSGNNEGKSVSGQVSFNYTVSFISPGDGIDVELFRKVKAHVEGHDPAINHQVNGWGKEGEKDICMDLSDLSKEQVETLKSSINEMIAGSKKVAIYEDGTCREAR